ncbi:hypothetical protein ON010_g14763 [Phytophthora cinnamomi]|nr:hypothetical protein ON010_g14763 [Phytophthora cinnamomi]
MLPVSSSAVGLDGIKTSAVTREGRRSYVTPRALETDEIPGVVADYKRAAENAIAAGFDGVELHGANGYLLEQFLCDGVNKRTDRYGGSIENRARLMLEALDAVLSSLDSSQVAIRLSPFGVTFGCTDSTPEETYGYVLEKLNTRDLAYVHIVEPRGFHFRGPRVPKDGTTPFCRPRYNGVLMTSSGFDRAEGIKVTESGLADCVAYGRPFISNPDFVRRLEVGAPWNPWDRKTFYVPASGPLSLGYTDYPTLESNAMQCSGHTHKQRAAVLRRRTHLCIALLRSSCSAPPTVEFHYAPRVFSGDLNRFNQVSQRQQPPLHCQHSSATPASIAAASAFTCRVTTSVVSSVGVQLQRVNPAASSRRPIAGAFGAPGLTCQFAESRAHQPTSVRVHRHEQRTQHRGPPRASAVSPRVDGVAAAAAPRTGSRLGRHVPAGRARGAASRCWSRTPGTTSAVTQSSTTPRRRRGCRPRTGPTSGATRDPRATRLNPAVEETYEAAFRLIQLAAEAERSGNPLQAIQLYTDAGDVLIKVGKGEPDPLLKQGIREKANEIMKRAEELDEWYYSVQESARKAALPPQLQIQRTQVPRVQEAWQGRKPTLSQAPEFTHMRYTAVSTKDPVKFSDDGFQLRVEETGKKIRVFITITMYNEEGSELQGTLTGIARNLEFMAEQWGDRAWESVAVAVVSDGRTKASASCLDFLTGLGAFDEEIMTVTSMGVDVQLHLFEATVQLVRDDNFESFYPPIQLIYALKENNAGKLNSHLWFFNAFSEQLLPTYTVLVDVGTIPGPTSIFRLVRSMDRNPQIGGVAGEIAVDHPNYFNPVIAAQHFEYKISNIMDKSLESVLGFISVLPGAFSAYRYEAIRAEKGVGPLPEYFKSLTTSTRDLGPFKGNMYLAEDRILCFELLARRGRNWTMHYVKDAIARTDVPETLVDLIKQRRRWLNGSFFAGLFAISNFSRVWKESGHSLPRKIVLTLHKYPALLAIVLGIYLAIVGGIVVFALGNRPEKRTAAFYSFSYVFMGLVMLVVSVISIYGLVADVSVTDPRKNLATCSVSNFELVGGVVTAIGLVFASAFIHGEFSVLLSTLQYYFMLPTTSWVSTLTAICTTSAGVQKDWRQVTAQPRWLRAMAT